MAYWIRQRELKEAAKLMGWIIYSICRLFVSDLAHIDPSITDRLHAKCTASIAAASIVMESVNLHARIVAQSSKSIPLAHLLLSVSIYRLILPQ